MVAENQPGHIDQIKQTNAGAVYRLIDQLGPVSRIDLSVWRSWLLPVSLKLSVRCSKHTWCKSWKSKKRGTVAVRQWGWWLKLKPGTIFLRISRGEIFLALRDLSSKLVVEEAQELALKDDSPLLDRIISHIDQFFIRHQKNLSV